MSRDRYRRGLAFLGWAGLLLPLPLALLAITHAPNKHAASLGIDALDCDGPLRIYLIALPVLHIYGAGTVINVRRRHGRINLIAGALCVLLCVAVTANLVRAVIEERRQAAACTMT